MTRISVTDLVAGATYRTTSGGTRRILAFHDGRRKGKADLVAFEQLTGHRAGATLTILATSFAKRVAERVEAGDA